MLVQRKALSKSTLNLAGERHDISGERRDEEEQYASKKSGGGKYWTESEFRTGVAGAQTYGDPRLLRAEQWMTVLNERWLNGRLARLEGGEKSQFAATRRLARQEWALKRSEFADDVLETSAALVRASSDPAAALHGTELLVMINALSVLHDSLTRGIITATDARSGLLQVSIRFPPLAQGKSRRFEKVSKKRGQAMHQAAESSAGVKGVWKVGNEHIEQIKGLGVANSYELLTRNEFEDGFQTWRRWRWLSL